MKVQQRRCKDRLGADERFQDGYWDVGAYSDADFHSVQKSSPVSSGGEDLEMATAF